MLGADLRDFSVAEWISNVIWYIICHICNERVYKVVPIEVQNGQIKNKTPPTKIVTTIDLPVGFCQIEYLYTFQLILKRMSDKKYFKEPFSNDEYVSKIV